MAAHQSIILLSTEGLLPTEEEESLYKHPLRINKLDPNVQLTIGDLHGNTLKFLFFLIKEGVMSFSGTDEEQKEQYNKIVEIYKKAGDITHQDLQSFEDILQTAVINKDNFDNVTVRLLGDEFADRGNNDYLTLLLLKRLDTKQGKDGCLPKLEIIYSNHGAEFVRFYREYLHNYFNYLEQEHNTPIPYIFKFKYKPHNSVENLLRLINFQKDKEGNIVKLLDENGRFVSEPVRKFMSLIQNHYIYKLKLLSYYVDENNNPPTIYIYTHAPVGLNTIYKLMQTFGITNKNEKHCSVFIEKIEQLNQAFQTYLLSGKVDIQGLTGIKKIINNREAQKVIGPKSILFVDKIYEIRFVHGHHMFSTEEKEAHENLKYLTCLDTNFGKSEEVHDNKVSDISWQENYDKRYDVQGISKKKQPYDKTTLDTLSLEPIKQQATKVPVLTFEELLTKTTTQAMLNPGDNMSLKKSNDISSSALEVVKQPKTKKIPVEKATSISAWKRLVSSCCSSTPKQ